MHCKETQKKESSTEKQISQPECGSMQKKNNERDWKMDLLLFCYFRDKHKNKVKHLLLSNAFKVNNDASRMKNKQCSHTKTA